MVDGVRPGPTSISDLLSQGDGLTKVSEVFVETLGRELSSDALQALMFLRKTGCGDLARDILQAKRYMGSARDMANFIEKLSPAQHAKDMLEAQAKAFNDRMAR